MSVKVIEMIVELPKILHFYFIILNLTVDDLLKANLRFVH